MSAKMRPSVLKTWTPADVQNAQDQPQAFANYAQQALGVPWATQQDLRALRKKAKEFFEHYPHADWYTLCRVVQWAANRKIRYSRVWMLVDDFRKAYAAGALPELDPANARYDESWQEEVDEALAEETDEVWRRRLLLADGAEQQKEVLVAWRKFHGRA